MIFQAYLLFFLVCTLICIVVLAKHFFFDYLLDKDAMPSFWKCWPNFPAHQELIDTHARKLLVGLYWLQVVTFVALVLAVIFGDYSL